MARKVVIGVAWVVCLVFLTLAGIHLWTAISAYQQASKLPDVSMLAVAGQFGDSFNILTSVTALISIVFVGLAYQKQREELRIVLADFQLAKEQAVRA
jgi:hypothetical protein